MKNLHKINNQLDDKLKALLWSFTRGHYNSYRNHIYFFNGQYVYKGLATEDYYPLLNESPPFIEDRVAEWLRAGKPEPDMTLVRKGYM